jgi:hypothetical protein
MMDWIRDNRPDLEPRYRELYRHGAYAPSEERKRIAGVVSNHPAVVRVRAEAARLPALRRGEPLDFDRYEGDARQGEPREGPHRSLRLPRGLSARKPARPDEPPHGAAGARSRGEAQQALF